MNEAGKHHAINCWSKSHLSNTIIPRVLAQSITLRTHLGKGRRSSITESTYYYFLQLTGDRAWLPLSPSLRELRTTQGDCEVSSHCRRPVLWEWLGALPCPPLGAPPSPFLHSSDKGLRMHGLYNSILTSIAKWISCSHYYSHGGPTISTCSHILQHKKFAHWGQWRKVSNA